MHKLMRHWKYAGFAFIIGYGALLPALGTYDSFLQEGFVQLPSFGHSRALQQLAPSPLPALNISNNFLVLAKKRTARPDPLMSFKIYRGGWNIRSQDYWASVGYTAMPGFILAAAWLLIGAGCILLTCCCCCCCPHKLHGEHEGGDLFPFLLLSFFTVAAVCGCVLVYLGQGKAHNELSDTLTYVVNESDIVVDRLYMVSAALSDAQNLTVINFVLPTSDQQQITQLNAQLNTAARNLQNQTHENADRISSGLNDVRLAMVIVVGVMLLLVLLGFLFSVLGAMPLLFLLVFIGWFLIAGTWILCGVYIMLNNTVSDTCVAMEEWVANPSAETNLKDILPCVDTNTTNQTLVQSQNVMNDTVVIINSAVSQINAGSSNGLPLVCNPVHPELSPPSCVNITDVSAEWEKSICNSTYTANCPVQGKLTQKTFNELDGSTKVVDALNNNVPFLLDLRNCVFVRQVFTTIREKHCHPLQNYLKWQYIGLALISGGLMFTVFLWIAYSRRRKHLFFHQHHRHHPEPAEPKYDQFIQKAAVEEAA